MVPRNLRIAMQSFASKIMDSNRRLPHAGKYTNGQIGGGPPTTGQSERSIHVLPVLSNVSGLISQLSIAVTLTAAKLMERRKKMTVLMLMLMACRKSFPR